MAAWTSRNFRRCRPHQHPYTRSDLEILVARGLELMTTPRTGDRRRRQGFPLPCRRSAFNPPQGTQLDSEIGHRHLLHFGELEPSFLFLRVERRNLGVMTPGETIPTSGYIDGSRHISHVAEALHVITGDFRRLLVLLTPAAVAVPNPVSKPPLTASGHRTKPLAHLHPTANVDILTRHPGHERGCTR